ncbi:XdhC protein (assists in molybdopterin insertion into xanthine dehydrogenase) [Candidatus Rhodobacter oscarellae]|uniref:XdhC protein (Assists in molybdopterin insertion into xanthine dehydrogenase) n=1 Tax=Candidatus Rhodobacter oscarellae TaxID=1675527 RepID=A0A0J9EC19_9RHOB|nr:xanthine dehydrogenase accessory protein XdhC [Candidatus Rhodobacter lobularis]KMW59234.1 XdhC protein (assists in molybdopterin insertion into xanthine dehydrogenase) [Candidatus Rhodobacter lobularis]
MIDLSRLADLIAAHGSVARVVIAEHKGSAPRDTGTAMYVWRDGQQGTIGGGHLEHAATKRAREILKDRATIVTRHALGPDLGQCCGGAVTLVTEAWDAARARDEIDAADWPFAGIFLRRVEGDAPLPQKLRRKLAMSSEMSGAIKTQLVEGWLVEQVWEDRQPVYIYGAGHVGQALARVLAPLPQFETWVADVRPDLMAALPESVHRADQVPPTAVMAKAPPEAAHFIMTPEHDYDLELCHTVLQRPFEYAGLIGSATKWARFRKRLRELGHAEAQIDRIECPIGAKELGKDPHAIAIGVAARLLDLRRLPGSLGTGMEL